MTYFFEGQNGKGRFWNFCFPSYFSKQRGAAGKKQLIVFRVFCLPTKLTFVFGKILEISHATSIEKMGEQMFLNTKFIFKIRVTRA